MASNADPDKKVLNVNPELFNVSRFRSTAKNNSSSNKPIVPNQQTLKRLKRETFNKIKEHQRKIQLKLQQSSKASNKSILNEENNDDGFNESLSYLQSLGKEMKTAANTITNTQQQQPQTYSHNQTFHNRSPLHVNSPVPAYLTLPESFNDDNNNNNNPDYFLPVEDNNDQINRFKISNNNNPHNIIQPAPSYGILKGGNKVTYRAWKQAAAANAAATNGGSMKKSVGFTDTPVPIDIMNHNVLPVQDITPLSDREYNFMQLRNKFNGDTSSVVPSSVVPYSDPSSVSPSSIGPSSIGPSSIGPSSIVPSIVPSSVVPCIPCKKKKTIRRAYIVGRAKTDPKKIGVFVANRKTRREWQNELTKLKSTPIQKMKKELIQHKLLKVGSTAPNDVIREMYKNSILAGDVYNNDPSITLHNFLNDDSTTKTSESES